MSSPAFEVFLARLYADDDLRMRFLASPADVAWESGLSADERDAIVAIDRDGLILAGKRYARKRRNKPALDRSRFQFCSRMLRLTLKLHLLVLEVVARLHSRIRDLAARRTIGSE